MPVLLFAEITALGANGPLLSVAVAVLEIVAAMAVLALLEPDAMFWRRAWPVLLLAALAITWAAAPWLLRGTGLAAVAQRPAPDLLLPGMVRLFGGFAVLLAGGIVGYRRGLVRVSLDALLVLSMTHLLLALVLRQSDPHAVWGYAKGFLQWRFTGTFLNANASGCLFGMVAVLALGRWLALLRPMVVEADPWSRPMRLLCPAALLGGLGACAITESRTALTLTLATLVAVAAIDRELWHRLRRSRQLAIAAVGATVVASGAVLWLVGDATAARLAMTQHDSVERIAIWSHYATLAAAVPVFGYGPGAFDTVTLASLASPDQARFLWFIHSPHNEPLSLLLTAGWPYLALIVATGAAMLAAIARHGRSRLQDPLRRGVLAALILAVGCSLIDIALDVPAIAALFIFLLAILWGRAIRMAAERHLIDSAAEPAGPARLA